MLQIYLKGFLCNLLKVDIHMYIHKSGYIHISYFQMRTNSLIVRLTVCVYIYIYQCTIHQYSYQYKLII